LVSLCVALIYGPYLGKLLLLGHSCDTFHFEKCHAMLWW